LDVGADKGTLRQYLPEGTKYELAGWDAHHDIQVDLENLLPVKDNSYDCVLCLDVLEHVENIHQLFDELCRVTKKYVVVSLPNPWADFYAMLRGGFYAANKPLKFYNLPINPPEDRHRWFFGATEAKLFIKKRGNKNNMKVLQIDQEYSKTRRTKINRFFLSLIFNNSIPIGDLLGSTIWAVLEKKQ